MLGEAGRRQQQYLHGRTAPRGPVVEEASHGLVRPPSGRIPRCPTDVAPQATVGTRRARPRGRTDGARRARADDAAGGRYTLGQLFNQWNVALDATRIGGLRSGAGMTLRAFVDGVEVPGNPAAVELRDHQQVALVYGPSRSPVSPPATYDFSNA